MNKTSAYASLHRQLMYEEIYSWEDCDLPENVRDKLYELYVTTKDSAVGKGCSIENVFSEVFYNLTSIYYDTSSAEHVSQYMNESEMLIYPDKGGNVDNDEVYDEQQFLARRYVYSFVWLILKMQSKLPKHVRFFLLALDKKINDKNPFYPHFRDFLKNVNLKTDIQFAPHPETFRNSFEPKVWHEETKDFDQDEIIKIAGRFSNIASKEYFIKDVREALTKYDEEFGPSADFSLVTLGNRANNDFLDSLLQKSAEEENQRIEQEREVEKSKDERIKELEAQIIDLEREKEGIENDRDHWKREYEILAQNFKNRNRRLESQRVPAEFKQLPGSKIIYHLINSGIIRVLYRNGNSNSEDMLYKWEGTKKLFGYFVERVSYELSLRKSGKSGNIIWEPFMQAFYESEDLRHEAASAISAMKKKGAFMPDGADKIEEAIKYANGEAM